MAKGQGGWEGGLIIVLLLFIITLALALVLLIVKIAIVLFFAKEAYATFKLLKNDRAKNILRFSFFLMGAILSFVLFAYLAMVDIEPAFLDIPAQEYPSLCELHTSPILVLNPLTVLQEDYFGGKHYAACMADTYGAGLESCNMINTWVDGAEQAMEDCIEHAVESGSTDCEVLKEWHQYSPDWPESYCFDQISQKAVGADDCEVISNQERRDDCLYHLAYRISDIDTPRGKTLIKDVRNAEICDRIVGNDTRKQCQYYFVPELNQTIPE